MGNVNDNNYSVYYFDKKFSNISFHLHNNPSLISFASKTMNQVILDVINNSNNLSLRTGMSVIDSDNKNLNPQLQYAYMINSLYDKNIQNKPFITKNDIQCEILDNYERNYSFFHSNSGRNSRNSNGKKTNDSYHGSQNISNSNFLSIKNISSIHDYGENGSRPESLIDLDMTSFSTTIKGKGNSETKETKTKNINASNQIKIIKIGGKNEFTLNGSKGKNLGHYDNNNTFRNSIESNNYNNKKQLINDSKKIDNKGNLNIKYKVQTVNTNDNNNNLYNNRTVTHNQDNSNNIISIQKQVYHKKPMSPKQNILIHPKSQRQEKKIVLPLTLKEQKNSIGSQESTMASGSINGVQKNVLFLPEPINKKALSPKEKMANNNGKTSLANDSNDTIMNFFPKPKSSSPNLNGRPSSNEKQKPTEVGSYAKMIKEKKQQKENNQKKGTNFNLMKNEGIDKRSGSLGENIKKNNKEKEKSPLRLTISEKREKEKEEKSRERDKSKGKKNKNKPIMVFNLDLSDIEEDEQKKPKIENEKKEEKYSYIYNSQVMNIIKDNQIEKNNNNETEIESNINKYKTLKKNSNNPQIGKKQNKDVYKNSDKLVKLKELKKQREKKGSKSNINIQIDITKQKDGNFNNECQDETIHSQNHSKGQVFQSNALNKIFSTIKSKEPQLEKYKLDLNLDNYLNSSKEDKESGYFENEYPQYSTPNLSNSNSKEALSSRGETSSKFSFIKKITPTIEEYPSFNNNTPINITNNKDTYSKNPQKLNFNINSKIDDNEFKDLDFLN